MPKPKTMLRMLKSGEPLKPQPFAHGNPSANLCGAVLMLRLELEQEQEYTPESEWCLSEVEALVRAIRHKGWSDTN